MIAGIGVDIIEKERILKAIEKKSFLDKYFTDGEHQIIKEQKSRAASNFAGKEAVAKAMGTGFAGFLPADIEILRKPGGAPYVLLHNGAMDQAKSLGINYIHISLSDTKDTAIAYVVLE
ncbi:MAG: holo-ACP synthase [Lachnospiraceae bacterium]|nr:holo-ACP synthase [Lachnospiraceae bacterium]